LILAAVAWPAPGRSSRSWRPAGPLAADFLLHLAAARPAGPDLSLPAMRWPAARRTQEKEK